MNIQNKVEENIKTLSNVFQKSINDYFFTEKEIHSYFYHLCIEDQVFKYDNQFNLIHAEYPSPFKCEIIDQKPFMNITDINSKNREVI